MWMMPLHLHVNQKSDYDIYDDPLQCIMDNPKLIVSICKGIPSEYYKGLIWFHLWKKRDILILKRVVCTVLYSYNRSTVWPRLCLRCQA